MTVVIERSAARPKPAIVSVNGIVISGDAIAREIQHHPAPKPAAAWHAAAQALVVRELLLQEARRVGIKGTAQSDARGRRETKEEALVRALIEQEVRTPEPDETSCRRYYAQNRARFRSPAIYEAAHILLPACRDDAEAFGRAQRQAEALLGELREHPERFADLARLHSGCPSAAQGGSLGQITAGQTTPEFEQALFALVPGRIGDAPVATRYGVHILRLDRRIDGRELPFELVAERIADYLREGVNRRATAQYIARLVSRAAILGVVLAGAEAHRVA